MSEQAMHSGYIAIVGRPNVGKSTLLNRILGQKISITARKPQTTRHQILGVKTTGSMQAIYVDTPGMHKHEPQALNRMMNRAASNALQDVDLVLFVVDRLAWTDEDQWVLEKLKVLDVPIFLLVNKIDRIRDKEALLPHLQNLAQQMDFAEIIPVSAQRGDQISELENLIAARLPEGIHYFPEDQVTNRSERFLAAELVREKIMRQLGEEIPYQVAVEIERFTHDDKVLHVDALILVEREGQKKIIIGKKGEQLKTIGRDARLDMERVFDTKVMLNLWVKVRSGWSDNERALRSLGYEDWSG